MLYHFANCTLDTERHEFHRGGKQIHLEPQVFDLLELLAQHAGVLVTRDQMIEQVWRGLIVSESTISARISAARVAVGDTGKDQRVIRTVPRRGFQMVAEVVGDGPAPKTPPPDDDGQDIRFAPSAGGVNIAYALSGSGPPLMRVGHWLSHLELDWQSPIWRPLLDRLGAQHSLCRYDLRSTGLSVCDLDDQDIDAFVGDVEAVANKAGLDHFPIFAASQAVPVAIKFAALHPERVSKLVLYGGYGLGRSLRDPIPGQVDEATFLSMIRAGWGVPDSPFIRAFATLFVPGATPEQLDDFVRLQLLSSTAENAIKLRGIIDGFDVRKYLPQVQAPTLVVHARGDAAQPIEQSRLIASEIPDARFLMLDDNNHVPLPQMPAWQTLMDRIDVFLAEPV